MKCNSPIRHFNDYFVKNGQLCNTQLIGSLGVTLPITGVSFCVPKDLSCFSGTTTSSHPIDLNNLNAQLVQIAQH